MMKKGLFIVAVILFLSPFYVMAQGDDIVVISHNRHDDTITEKVLKRIYLKRKTLWKDGSRIIPINLPPQNKLRILFSKETLKKSHKQLLRYWNEQHFKGLNPPLVLESEEAVKRFVRNVEGAIGYIRRKNLEPDLKVLYTIRVGK